MPLLIPFILSCFKAGSPFKTIAIGLIATVLFSGVGVVAYKLYTNSAKIVKLNEQVTKVTNVATELTTTVKDTKASIEVNNTAEVAQAAIETQTAQQHAARQVVANKRIADIVNNKTLTVAVAEEDLSKVYITNVIAEYCASVSVDQSYCTTQNNIVSPPPPNASDTQAVDFTVGQRDSTLASLPDTPEPPVVVLNSTTDKELT